MSLILLLLPMHKHKQPLRVSLHNDNLITLSRCIHGVRTTLFFLHCMSQFRLDNIISHYQKEGLSTRIHGNVKRLPHNSIPFEEVQRVCTFIEKFARAQGIPLAYPYQEEFLVIEIKS